MYREGDVLGRFVVESYVAAGGMGTVYRGKDDTGRRVAIKVLGREARGRQSLLPAGIEDQRFAREVRLLSQHDHPGIVRYVGHGSTIEGDAYLVMEWLEGRTLDERLKAGPLSAKEAMLLALRAAEALAGVHAAGIVHRDLKPSNLFLEGGDVDRLKLIDFGIAHLERTESLAGELVGTFAYMSPEQARGVVDLDSRSDVFALGSVIHRAVTGKRPFEAEHVIGMLGKIQAEDPPHLSWDRPEIPIDFGDLVARMLAKAPEDRPRDGAAIVRAMGTQAPPESSRAPAIGDRGRQVASVLAMQDAPDLEAVRKAARPFAAEIIPLGRDAVLAILTGRQNARDQSVQAARCALALKKILASSSRIAMCTGFSEVARGSRVGEAIDGAAALLASAEPSSIRVDDVTAGLLATDFDVTGGVLVGPTSRQRTAREILGKKTPFVGRDAEIRELAKSIDDAVRARASRAILVTGEAGAGKTRLQAELVRTIARGANLGIAFGRGDPLSAGASFAMLSQLLRGMLGVWGKTPEVRRACIRARVSEHHDGAPGDRIAEMIGELVGVPFPESSHLRTARRDPAVMQDAMRAALAAFVAAECNAQPWLFVLEDAHWGDLPSMKLVDTALASAKPLVVLALARPTITEVFPDLWKDRSVRTIALRPLDEKACAELARAVLGDVDVRGIATRSGGNAFFLEELVRAMGSGTELPETVVAMAASRVDALDAGAQRVLRAASVFGETFTEEGVSALVGAPARDAILALGKRDWFVSLPDGELGFQHDLLRQAAYDTLTTRDRTTAHALAAAHLERRGETRPLVLAEHWERGGKPDRAAVHFASAARQAIDGNDYQRAIDCTVRGAKGAPKALEGVLLLLRSEAHRWNNDTKSGAAAAIEASTKFEPGAARWFDAAAEIVWSSGYSGNYDRVAEWADIAASTEHASGAHEAKLVCLSRSGTHLIHGDRVAHAQRILERVDAIAGEYGLSDAIVRAWVHLLRAWLAYYDGDWERYLAGQKSVAAAFEDAGDRRNACRETVNYGHALMEIGAYREAIEVMTEARAHAERAQLDAVVTQASQNIGYALGQMGKTREGLEELERGRMLVTSNLRHTIGLALYVSIIARRAGDFERAEREARSVLETSMTIPTLRAQTHAAIAAALIGRGLAKEAVPYAQEAERVLASLGSVEELDALLRLIIAETRLANGDRAGAKAILDDARDRLLRRIVPERLRAGFFAIPEHARITALCEQLK